MAQGVKFNYDMLDIDELIDKYNKYHSLTKVAQYYGCDRHTLSKWIKQNHINIHLKNKIPYDIQEKIIEAYDTTPSTELAQTYNITISAVNGIWHRHGLKGKPPRMYHILNENFFSVQTNDMAYFCGLIGSDGCIYTPKNNKKADILSITLQQQDKYILEILTNKLQTNKPISEYIKNNKNYCNLQISNQKICDDLRALGLNNRKTYGNTIANINNIFMFDLIRGYIDGDGTITYNNNRPRISIAGYYSNMNKLKMFLEKFNIYSIIIKDKREYTPNSNSDVFVSLTFPNKTSIYCLLKLLYHNPTNCYLPRKKQIADKIIQNIEQSNAIKDKQIIVYYNYAVLNLIKI